MKRKILMVWLAILLVAVPLLGSFSKEAAAASTRVAVIKELKGTVKVKKAGGSKEFTAFAKMSLNEGDVLAAGSGGSAVLQFANGTSEDDKMTVASNTKLTFSKLSNKKGTTTKVSMWSGSAWVDVKSITNKDDQFTLETPTAVMGVRGTHLLVTVNPNTGATSLMVAAGVVQTTSTSGGGEAQYVYPTQNALITNEESGSDITIAPADLETLMKQGNADIVKAIIQGAADITAENEQYVQRYENGQVPKEIGGTSADLERFKNNTQNLLGALAAQAVQTGLISQERMNQLIEEAGKQTGYRVDLTKSSLQLTEAEKAKQEAQRKKEEAAAKLEAERKAKEEAERKRLEETVRKLEEERKAREKAAQEALEEKKKQALEKYESQLSDAEKKRLKDEVNKRQDETKAAQSSASPSPSPRQSPSPSSSPSPSQTPVLSGNANLSGLSITVGNSPLTLSPAFSSNTVSYMASFPSTVEQVRVAPVVDDTGKATVKVNGASLSSGSAIVTVGTSSTKAIDVVVTAENGTTKTYSVTLTRSASNNAANLSGFGISYRSVETGEWLSAGEVTFQGNETQSTWMHSVPYEFKDIRILPRTLDPAATIVSVNGAVLTDGLYYPVQLEAGLPQTLVIESLASDQVTRQTFILQITREAFMTIPSSLESWGTTTTPATTDIVWTNVGYQQFAAQSPNQVFSFTLGLSFKSSWGIASAKLFLDSDKVEGHEIATWSASGETKTIHLPEEGHNKYFLRFYSSSGNPVNGHNLFFFNGETDPSVTDLGYIGVSNSDGSFNTSATQSGNYAFAQVSPEIDQARITLHSNNNVKRLFADGAAYPLESASYDTYNVHLQPGINKFQIVVKDFTGYYKQTYEFTILREGQSGSVASFLTQLKLLPESGMPLRVFLPSVDGQYMEYKVNQDMVPDFGIPITIVANTS
ncbi:MAG: cadherin-like beta sandwich domain-containing protein, partial [Cohnella sp.]|nr:cadherin-like beta sandwich domain-containing protein [Cohnella sp.]